MISQQFISLIQLERNAKDNPQDSEKEVIKKKKHEKGFRNTSGKEK